MATIFNQSRTQILLGFCLPLAVLVGFFLAEPLQFSSIAVLLMLLAVLASPLLFRWHQPMLMASWNAAIILTFLPGSPPLWMPLAAVSCLIVVLNRATSDQYLLRHVPSVTRPLLALMGVVILTAWVTGGIGIRSLGSSSYGGRGYFYITLAAAGYLGLASRPVPPRQAGLYAGLFFLSGTTPLLSNLAFSGGPSFWWLYRFLPGTFAYEQITGQAALNAQMVRLVGIGPASLALYSFLLARFGLRGIVDFRRPWLLLLGLLTLWGCLYSGFRSPFVLFGLLTIFQFFLEKLHRTRALPACVGGFLLLGTLLIAGADRLPLVMQRSLSVLPIKVSSAAQASTEDSNEWRVEMWRSLLISEVPHYLLKGKGYGFNPNDLNMAIESSIRGYGERYQSAREAGDYHNGPLSVVIPFGIWGLAAFGWFLVASIRYLYSNYRHGNPALRTLNTFLLTYFLAKAVFFLLIYGVFYEDLGMFLGLIGLSAAFNGLGRGRLVRPAAVNRVSKLTPHGERSRRPKEAGPGPADAVARDSN